MDFRRDGCDTKSPRSGEREREKETERQREKKGTRRDRGEISDTLTGSQTQFLSCFLKTKRKSRRTVGQRESRVVCLCL